MKKRIFSVLLTSAVYLVSAPGVFADNTVSISKHVIPNTKTVKDTSFSRPMMPPKIDVNAKAWILMDAESGQVIAEKNSHERLPPASLTKMMTSYILSQAIDNGSVKLNDMVRISKDAWKTGGSKMFVKVGNKVSIENLMKGMIIQSGNDATVALSEYVAGSQNAFADLMNQNAQYLNMKDTHFVNPDGLPDSDHYSTAYDLSLLARAIATSHPSEYKWYSEKWFTWNGIKQPNRNRLLWRDKYVDGIKTGHTSAAGYCLAASAKKDGMRLVAVVMGTPNDEARNDSAQKLLTYGFRFYTTHKIYDKNQTIQDTPVWYGKEDFVKIGVDKPIYITTPKGQYKNLQANLSLIKDLNAPITKNQQVGLISFSLNGNKILTQPVYALDAVEKGNFFERMVSKVKFWFHSDEKDKG